MCTESNVWIARACARGHVEYDRNAQHDTMIMSIISDMPAPFVLAVALAGVFLIAFMKGAFGGGFAIVGIPLLSLAMDPIAAGALLAPLFVVMDITALRFWRPNTWSRVDLAMLLPALVVGIGLGYFVLRDLDRHAVEIVMGLVTLVFAGYGIGIATAAQLEAVSASELVLRPLSDVTSQVKTWLMMRAETPVEPLARFIEHARRLT